MMSEDLKTFRHEFKYYINFFEYHNLRLRLNKVLKFDKFGVLKSKKIYNKDNTNEIAFSEKKTTNELSKKSFVESFLSSLKQKMYGNRK